MKILLFIVLAFPAVIVGLAYLADSKYGTNNKIIRDE